MCNKSFVKKRKETRTHHEDVPAAACCCWQGGGVGREAKLSLWAEFRPFMWEDHCWWLKKKLDVVRNKLVKNWKETRTHHEDVSTASSCCWQGDGVGREAKLSLWAEFRPFMWEDHCWWLKKILDVARNKLVKNWKETRTHHKDVSAAASCCWQGGGVGREAKLSLWAEFWPFSWEDHCCWLKKNLDAGRNHS